MFFCGLERARRCGGVRVWEEARAAEFCSSGGGDMPERGHGGQVLSAERDFHPVLTKRLS